MSLHQKCFDKFMLDQQQWAVFSFMLCRNPKLVSVGLKSNRERSAKVKQILFALRPDIEVHFHQGRAKMKMTKYWCQYLDQIQIWIVCEYYICVNRGLTPNLPALKWVSLDKIFKYFLPTFFVSSIFWSNSQSNY